MLPTKLSTLFVFLTFAVFSSAQSNTVLSLKIPGSTGKKVIFSCYSDDYLSRNSDTLYFDQDEEVNYSLSLSRPQYVKMEMEGNRRQFFLQAGTSLQATLDTATSYLSFQGDLALENQYLDDLTHKVEYRIKPYYWESLANQPLDSLLNQIERWVDVKKKVLNEYFPDKKVHQAFFYQLQLMDIKLLEVLGPLDYINTYTADKKEKDQAIIERLDKSFLDFEAMIPFLEANFAWYMYERYVMTYFKVKKWGKDWHQKQKEMGYHEMALSTSNEFYPSPLKEKLLNDKMNDLISYGLVDYSQKFTPIDSLIAKFGPILGDSKVNEYQLALEEYKRKRDAYQPGQPLPAIVLKDSSNNDYLLNEKYGVAVLFDIWASWCAPCVRAFPKAEALATQYAGQLKLVSISIDDWEDNFKNGLKQYNVPGSPCLWAEDGSTSKFVNFFQIVNVPQYLLVDQNGKIVVKGSFAEVKEGIKELGL